MTKPWEETWEAGGTPYLDFGVGYVKGKCASADFTNDGRGDCDDPEIIGRAKLAACAPEMARMLLTVEFAGGEATEAGGSIWTSSCCPVCHVAPSRTPYGELASGPHEPNCALDVLLRKAGVR